MQRDDRSRASRSPLGRTLGQSDLYSQSRRGSIHHPTRQREASGPARLSVCWVILLDPNWSDEVATERILNSAVRHNGSSYFVNGLPGGSPDWNGPRAFWYVRVTIVMEVCVHLQLRIRNRPGYALVVRIRADIPSEIEGLAANRAVKVTFQSLRIVCEANHLRLVTSSDELRYTAPIAHAA